jgi:hypothetical protein
VCNDKIFDRYNGSCNTYIVSFMSSSHSETSWYFLRRAIPMNSKGGVPTTPKPQLALMTKWEQKITFV